MTEVLTIDELCAWLKIDRTAVYGMCRTRARKRHGDRALPHFKVAGSIRFRRQDIEAWLERLSKEDTA